MFCLYSFLTCFEMFEEVEGIKGWQCLNSIFSLKLNWIELERTTQNQAVCTAKSTNPSACSSYFIVFLHTDMPSETT